MKRKILLGRSKHCCDPVVSISTFLKMLSCRTLLVRNQDMDGQGLWLEQWETGLLVGALAVGLGTRARGQNQSQESRVGSEQGKCKARRWIGTRAGLGMRLELVPEQAEVCGVRHHCQAGDGSLSTQ